MLRHAGSVEEISEAALGGAGFKGYAIEEELRSGSTQKQATWSSRVHGCLELAPCRIELAGRARML